MDKEKDGKVTALATVAVVMALSLVGNIDWRAVGVYPSCPAVNRLTYQFFHTSPLHAAVNAWCVLSVVFIHKVSLQRLMFAYTASAFVPANTIGMFAEWNTPTVGLSGVAYALLGTITFNVARKRYFQSCMAVYITLGFVLPKVNAWLHLYCYLCGLALACLNKPIRRKI